MLLYSKGITEGDVRTVLLWTLIHNLIIIPLSSPGMAFSIHVTIHPASVRNVYAQLFFQGLLNPSLKISIMEEVSPMVLNCCMNFLNYYQKQRR